MTINIAIKQNTITFYEINKIAHMLQHFKGIKVKISKAIEVEFKKPYQVPRSIAMKLAKEDLIKFRHKDAKIFFIGFGESKFFGNITRRFRLEIEGMEHTYFQYY